MGQFKSTVKHLGILGGVFDPIHNGHLSIAKTLLNKNIVEKILFIPCKQQVIKHKALASAEDRVTMLELALKSDPRMQIDKREIERSTPSYAFDTLESLRKEFPDAAISFILGEDAFATLPHWYRWEELTNFAHFIVVNRPHSHLPDDPALLNFLKEHQTTNEKNIKEKKCGYILMMNIPSVDISSTEIRKYFLKENDEDIKNNIENLLPLPVAQYIKQHHLYKK